MPRRPAAATSKRMLPEGSGTGFVASRVVQRPDGYHALALDGRQEFGPFQSFEEAQAAIDAAFDGLDGKSLVEGAPLPEAEAEIGIADWLDPETGEPAEGGCPPHLDAE